MWYQKAIYTSNYSILVDTIRTQKLKKIFFFKNFSKFSTQLNFKICLVYPEITSGDQNGYHFLWDICLNVYKNVKNAVFMCALIVKIIFFWLSANFKNWAIFKLPKKIISIINKWLYMLYLLFICLCCNVYSKTLHFDMI